MTANFSLIGRLSYRNGITVTEDTFGFQQAEAPGRYIFDSISNNIRGSPWDSDDGEFLFPETVKHRVYSILVVT